jgi:hypothetical protein
MIEPQTGNPHADCFERLRDDPAAMKILIDVGGRQAHTRYRTSQ